MTNENDDVYIRHMIDAADAIDRFLHDTSFDVFQRDELLQSAVLRKLKILGEAAKNVSDACKETTPHIPWKLATGTRDFVIHHYFGVDMNSVWNTATKNVPKLKNQLAVLLKDLL